MLQQYLIFTYLFPRLVPDTRDLLGARMLLTMTPEDGEEMKKAGETMTPELAQKAVEKAMTESPEFKVSNDRIDSITDFTDVLFLFKRRTTTKFPSF